MTAPLTSAMLAHYRDTLGWLPDRRYMLLNGPVSRAWDWGGGRGQPEAMTALAEVLALDPGLRVLVAHGYTDLVTPYFGSALLLRQLPAEAAPGGSRPRPIAAATCSTPAPNRAGRCAPTPPLSMPRARAARLILRVTGRAIRA